MRKSFAAVPAIALMLMLPPSAAADDRPGAAPARTFESLRDAAEHGDAEAQCGLGLAYAEGTEVPQDKAAAESWLRKAAEQGYAKAQFLLGVTDHLRKEDAGAVAWWKRAAEQGYASAQTALGGAYLLGEGVPSDEAEALKWLRRAAGQGDAMGQSLLGVAYANGTGVGKDFVQAYLWDNLAAARGNAEAARERDRLEKLMSGDQVAEAQRLTREWAPAAGRP